ncbi:hypothetical protein DET49_10676 [Salegentibacter sp. 24]|jgi:hypothetical protein|nr:hypothetical protein DET49_10676 [Salegentibacter sp. 24]
MAQQGNQKMGDAKKEPKKTSATPKKQPPKQDKAKK